MKKQTILRHDIWNGTSFIKEMKERTKELKSDKVAGIEWNDVKKKVKSLLKQVRKQR